MSHNRTILDNFPEKSAKKRVEVLRVLKPIKVTAWENDFTVNYQVVGNCKGGGKKQEIYQLTKGSLQNMAFVAHNTSIQFELMVTLTYPKNYPSCGKTVKYHLDRFIRWMRTKKVGVVSFFWFMEFQRRGAPHFHIFTAGGNLLNLKKQVSKRWYEIVSSNDPKHLKAGTRVEAIRHPEAAGRYASKYASKPYQKKIPNGYTNVGRWWGKSKDVTPEPLQEIEINSWDELEELTKGWSHWGSVRRRQPMKTLFNASKDVIKNRAED